MSDTCTHCSSPVGEKAKVQPTNCDGETWCPPCFIAKRMNEEPGRFNASQAAVMNCRCCGWKVVSFGAVRGKGLRCSHCGAFGGRPVPLKDLPITIREGKRLVEAVNDAASATAAGHAPGG